MAKKRKTRQEKIILQLKREVARQKNKPGLTNTHLKVRQGAKFKPVPTQTPKAKFKKKIDDSVFSYEPKLIRQDLFKTLILTLIVLSLEAMLYLKLR